MSMSLLHEPACEIGLRATHPGCFKVLGLLGLVVLSLAWGADRDHSQAQPVRKDHPLETEQFLGVGTCVTCHTQPLPQYGTDWVLLTEYTTWRLLDRHSQAYIVLKGPRAREMAQRLGTSPADLLNAATGCLGCHAMNFPRERQGKLFDIENGVSCDGCHGPSQRWLTPHYTDRDWRKLTGQEKETKFGMRDLRDPIKRAELCMSCHVGNVKEGKVITHAMYAAGHPPLPPFELETFCKNLPQHWRDLKDVPFLKEPKGYAAAEIHRNHSFGTAQVAPTAAAFAGNLVAARELMTLVAARADTGVKKDSGQRWPELAVMKSRGLPDNPRDGWPQIALAHTDCLACHHDLAYPSATQQRGYGLRLLDGQFLPTLPGRPQVQSWSLPLADLAIRRLDRLPDGDGLAKAWTTNVTSLVKATNARPFGEAHAVHVAASGFGQWKGKQPIGSMVREWSRGLVTEKGQFHDSAALRLLHDLCQLPAADLADCATARQVISVLQVVHRDWDPDQTRAPEAAKILGELHVKLIPSSRVGRQKRLELVRKDLLKLSKDLPENRRLQELLEKAAVGSLAKEEQDALRPLWTALAIMGDKEVTRVLLTDDSLTTLNQIGNEELDESLTRISGWNPAALKQSLTRFARLLPPPPKHAPASRSLP